MISLVSHFWFNIREKSDEKVLISRLLGSDESSVIVCFQLLSRQQLSRSFCHRCHRSYRSYRIIAGPHLHYY